MFHSLLNEELECPHHASTITPPTLKCSSKGNCRLRACATTKMQNSRAKSCSSSRARLREKGRTIEARLGYIHIQAPGETTGL